MTLDQWMTRERLTDQAFAAMVDSSPSGVRKWRKGRRVPRRDTMRRIVAATRGEVTAADFFAAQPMEDA